MSTQFKIGDHVESTVTGRRGVIVSVDTGGLAGHAMIKLDVPTGTMLRVKYSLLNLKLVDDVRPAG